MATMRFHTFLLSTALLAGISATAQADFTGPAPLAWRWVQPTAVAPSGTPLVSGDIVFTAVGQRMFALDKESGNRKWQYPTVEPVQGYFRTSPIMVENVVIAAADNKTLYAVDAVTGNAKWQYLAPSAILGQPIAVGKNVAFAMTNNTMMVLDGTTGAPYWTAPYKVFAGFIGGLAALGDSLVFSTSNYEMLNIDLATQKTLWRQKFTSLGPESTPVISGGNVYVSAGTFLISMNGSSGTGRWARNLGTPLASAPAVSPEGIFVGTRNGKAMLLDSGGQPKTKDLIDLGSAPLVKPSALGATFIQPTSNGALVLIDAATGKIVWNYLIRPLPGTSAQSETQGGNSGVPGGFPGSRGGGGNSGSTSPILTIPAGGPAALAGNTLLILARDGSLLAFDKELGADLTPPTVKMLWPTPGDQGASQPAMEAFFKIEDEASGVNDKTLKIDVDGTPLEFTYGRDGVAFLRISSGGKNKALTDGRHVFTVTVEDWLGNVAKTSYTVLIDNALRPLLRPQQENQPGGPGGGLGGPGGGGGKGIG